MYTSFEGRLSDVVSRGVATCVLRIRLKLEVKKIAICCTRAGTKTHCSAIIYCYRLLFADITSLIMQSFVTEGS